MSQWGFTIRTLTGELGMLMFHAAAEKLIHKSKQASEHINSITAGSDQVVRPIFSRGEVS